MSNRPPLHWGRVLADLKSDRATRPAVREEMLQRTPGLRGGNTLSGWRGQSGRRYVTRVLPLDSAAADEMLGAVALFVARDLSGVASIVCGARDLDPISAAHLLDRAADLGATELQLHRLSDPSEHAAILADLRAAVMEVA